MFFEVSHGPTLVYNNICLSDLSLLVTAQGIAFFNNLIAGRVRAGASPERYTPYHEPHSTKVKGLFNNTGGDIRFYNNIFLAKAKNEAKGKDGLEDYNRFPVYAENLSDSVRNTPDYLKFRFPVWAAGNVYFNHAKPFNGETEYAHFPHETVEVSLEKYGRAYYLKLSIDEKILKQVKTCAIDTEALGQTFISEAVFENSDGTPFALLQDFWGNLRNRERPMPGPFEKHMNLPIWKTN